MQLINYAAWIPEEKARLEVGTAPFPSKLSADEIIIKNHAVAVNPVDWKIQSSAGFGLQYPYILGEDVAGEVVEVGSGVKAAGKLKPGDRVIAHALGLGAGNPQYGGFQLYPRLRTVTVAKIPDDIPFWNAVVLPLSISTAAAGLYLKANLGLKLPSADGKKNEQHGVVVSTNPNNESQDPSLKKDKPATLLLWGGSSSVGSSVVQLAVASGYRVVATASPSNYTYVKSLGASLVLDYRNPDIETILIDVLRSDTAGELVGAYDAIGSEATVQASARVVHALGGGRVASVVSAPSDVPHDVTVTRIGSGNIVTQDDGLVARRIWGEFVPAALANGVLKPRPDELLVGRGLYFVQAGLDKQRGGVSARKVVVTL
jgi:NADPH:quinone reductase-like Zn-dependent oxidoreductase